MKFFYVIVAISFLNAVTAGDPAPPAIPVEPVLPTEHAEIPTPTCFLMKIEPGITAALTEGFELCKCFKIGVVAACDQYKDVLKTNSKLHNALNSLCDQIINPSYAASAHNQSCVCDTTSCKVPPVVLPPTTTTTAAPDKCNKTAKGAADKGTTIPDKECSRTNSNKTSTEPTTAVTGGSSNSSSTPAATPAATTPAATPAATTPAAGTPAATTTTAATPNTTSTTVTPPAEDSSTTETTPKPEPHIQEYYPLSSILWSVFGSLIAGFLLAVVVKMIYNRFRKRSYGTGHGA